MSFMEGADREPVNRLMGYLRSFSRDDLLPAIEKAKANQDELARQLEISPTILRSMLEALAEQLGTSLSFERRDLKPYIEPILAEDLQVGATYFTVSYVDDRLLVPTMAAVVFAGWNLCEGESGIAHFQDAASFLQGTRHDPTHAVHPETCFTMERGHLDVVFDFEHALEELMRCFLRRLRGDVGLIT